MTKTRERLVIGYDGSPDADAGLRWACDLAGRQGRGILVVVVITDIVPVLGGYYESFDEYGALWSDQARRVVAGQGFEDVEIVVRRGPTVPTLARAGEGMPLLVVGSRGHGLLTGSLTGSVSQHLARHAPCPVAVVRPPNTPDSRRIVVGVDGSPESASALSFACGLATDLGHDLVVVHGYHAYHAEFGSLEAITSETTSVHIAEAEQWLADWTRDRVKDFTGSVVTEAISVSPARAIIDASAAASTVVVGSRGRGAFTGMLLGSVSQQVLQHAHCPVVVTR